MAIIIAARDANITVHANKAIPDSGAGYLALALRKRATAADYRHYVPGCPSSGRSFISVVSVYDDTCVTVDRFTDVEAQAEIRMDFRALQVRNTHRLQSHFDKTKTR